MYETARRITYVHTNARARAGVCAHTHARTRTHTRKNRALDSVAKNKRNTNRKTLKLHYLFNSELLTSVPTWDDP